MATIQAGPGEIILFEDFAGAQVAVARTDATHNLGDFTVDGLNATDGAAGVPSLQAAALNGVGRMTTATAESDAIVIRTAVCFDALLNGPLVMECRIKGETITNQQVWFGLTTANNAAGNVEDYIIDTNSGGTTIDEFTATGAVGFLRSSELTAVAEWHAMYKGGTTSAPTATDDSGVELGVNAVAGDWQILRIEVDPDGTARWYIDGVLEKTLEGAASTTTDMGVQLVLENLTGTTAREMDVDYILVKANRDWTV